MLELLLVMVVMVFLAALVWPNMGNRTSAAKMESAANNLASLLKLARAEAMSTGNCYRCRFEAGGGKAYIEEEADPFKQAGVFTPIAGTWGKADLAADDLKCVAVQFDQWEGQLKAEEAKVLETEDQADKTEFGSPILFNADGTSDTVSILLGDTTNRNIYYTLSVNGLTGQVKIDQGNTLDVTQNKNK